MAKIDERLRKLYKKLNSEVNMAFLGFMSNEDLFDTEDFKLTKEGENEAAGFLSYVETIYDKDEYKELKPYLQDLAKEERIS